MQKEIFEQPESVVNTMRGRVNFDDYTGNDIYYCLFQSPCRSSISNLYIDLWEHLRLPDIKVWLHPRVESPHWMAYLKMVKGWLSHPEFLLCCQGQFFACLGHCGFWKEPVCLFRLRESARLHLFFQSYLFMRVRVMAVCMYVHHICAWCSWRLEEDIGSSGTGVAYSCEPSCGSWEQNPSLLQDHHFSSPVFLS